VYGYLGPVETGRTRYAIDGEEIGECIGKYEIENASVIVDTDACEICVVLLSVDGTVFEIDEASGICKVDPVDIDGVDQECVTSAIAQDSGVYCYSVTYDARVVVISRQHHSIVYHHVASRRVITRVDVYYPRVGVVCHRKNGSNCRLNGLKWSVFVHGKAKRVASHQRVHEYGVIIRCAHDKQINIINNKTIIFFKRKKQK
jgi:hypothetical protein